MTDCIFCRIVAGEIPSDKVLETDELLAFRDIQPQAPEHVLVIPKKHIETVDDLADEDGALTGRMILAARDIARNLGIAEGGYRLILNCRADAGQLVFHLHLHILGGRKMGALG
ncbi:MAG: histidine triad nucleotide-binding protein [Planctomycetota bacterium]|jgi:histidine triad (HIT) family protein